MVEAVIDVKALHKALQQFPVRVQSNIMVGAIRAGAAMLAKEAQLRAPKETKKLSKSIQAVKRKSEKSYIVFFTVAPRLKKPHGYLAHFHEFGTSKMVATPFMRPAYDTKGGDVIEAVKTYMAQRIDNEIVKANND